MTQDKHPFASIHEARPCSLLDTHLDMDSIHERIRSAEHVRVTYREENEFG